MAKTPVDLFAFGNRLGPRAPRIGIDIIVNERGEIPSDLSQLPAGASTFADPRSSGLTGHYHCLPAGTELPEGFSVTADGRDVLPESPLAETHHTLHPIVPMNPERFTETFLALPWEYGGRQ